jgi:hypothetical protein
MELTLSVAKLETAAPLTGGGFTLLSANTWSQSCVAAVVALPSNSNTLVTLSSLRFSSPSIREQPRLMGRRRLILRGSDWYAFMASPRGMCDARTRPAATSGLLPPRRNAGARVRRRAATDVGTRQGYRNVGDTVIRHMARAEAHTTHRGNGLTRVIVGTDWTSVADGAGEKGREPQAGRREGCSPSSSWPMPSEGPG